MYKKTPSSKNCKKALFVFAFRSREFNVNIDLTKAFALTKELCKISLTSKTIRRNSFQIAIVKEWIKLVNKAHTVLYFISYTLFAIIGLRTMSRGTKLGSIKRSEIKLAEIGFKDYLEIIFDRTKTRSNGRFIRIEPSKSIVCSVKWFKIYSKIRNTLIEEYFFVLDKRKENNRLTTTNISKVL
ncbi:hypothetical protein ABK040_016385 [Willaertia magna]